MEKSCTPLAKIIGVTAAAAGAIAIGMAVTGGAAFGAAVAGFHEAKSAVEDAMKKKDRDVASE